MTSIDPLVLSDSPVIGFYNRVRQIVYLAVGLLAVTAVAYFTAHFVLGRDDAIEHARVETASTAGHIARQFETTIVQLQQRLAHGGGAEANGIDARGDLDAVRYLHLDGAQPGTLEAALLNEVTKPGAGRLGLIATEAGEALWIAAPDAVEKAGPSFEVFLQPLAPMLEPWTVVLDRIQAALMVKAGPASAAPRLIYRPAAMNDVVEVPLAAGASDWGEEIIVGEQAVPSVPLTVFVVTNKDHALGHWREHLYAYGTIGGIVSAAAFLLSLLLLRSLERRIAAENQIWLQAAALEAAANAIFITDRDGRILWINSAFTRLSGYTKEEALHQTPRILNSSLQDQRFYAAMWRSITAGQVWSGEVVNRRADGSTYTVLQTVTPLHDPNGDIRWFLAIHEDITARREAEERITFLSNHDPLTGLPNRTLLVKRAAAVLGGARSGAGLWGAVSLDLDRFNHLNDTWGHYRGDQALAAIAGRMHACLEEPDLMARLEGDEFAAFLHAPDLEHLIQQVEAIKQAIEAPISVDSETFRLTASIGIAIHPQDGEMPQDLLNCADLAMHVAKEAGGNAYQFFRQELTTHARERTRIAELLRQAVAEDGFVLQLQPQIALPTGRLVGAEALLRLREGQDASPAQFIPLAEESGHIVEIGDWVMREACGLLRKWLDEGLPGVQLAVNLSPVQMHRIDVVALVESNLRAFDLPSEALEIEITESAAMELTAPILEDLRRLRNGGVSIAIDDFGTGFSSLSYLRQLPVNRLKIDQTFVRGIGHGRDDEQIVAAVIQLAHALGLEVVAEGVETSDQLNFLRQKQCDIVQGYLFSRPLPESQFRACLNRPDRFATQLSSCIAVA